MKASEDSKNYTVAFAAYKPKQFIIRYPKVLQLISIPHLFVMNINKKQPKRLIPMLVSA